MVPFIFLGFVVTPSYILTAKDSELGSTMRDNVKRSYFWVSVSLTTLPSPVTIIFSLKSDEPVLTSDAITFTCPTLFLQVLKARNCNL